MKEVWLALYQAVEQNENHAATVNAYLDSLRAARANALRDADMTTYRWCERKIERYTELLGGLHAERAELARRIKRAKGG